MPTVFTLEAIKTDVDSIRNNSMMLIVPGKNIIFRNFSGSPTRYNITGMRDFCLIINNKTLKRALEAKGCIFKKIKCDDGFGGTDDGTDFVKIKIPKNTSIRANLYISKYRHSDELFEFLDKTKITSADLELIFHKMTINGKEHTSIYLKNAKFNIEPGIEISMCWPNNNKTEETKMNTMTRAEVMGQLQLGITAYEMSGDAKKDPVVLKLMDAMKNAIEYIGEVPKNETKVKTVTIEKKVPVLPGIKQVIFNYPATVVIWEDDVKTVVECQKGDNYDMEKGLAMCICKRMMGNESNFNKQIKKYTDNVKNVQTKKKAKSGTFEERKAARMAQAEANKTANGRSKNFRGKDIVPRKRRGAPAIVNTNKMVVLTDAYADCVRRKMAKMGFSYEDTAKATGLCKSTINRYFSPNVICQKPKRITMANFKKINKTLGIRWRIEG